MTEQPTRALALVEEQRALSLTDAKLQLITRTVAKGAAPDELAVFLYQCRRTGLDPLSRQIYCIVRQTRDGPKAAIQTGIDGYRLVAQRTGVYAGSDDALYDEGLTQWDHRQDGRGLPTVATVTVWKLMNGVRVPFTATAAFAEYKPDRGDQMWQKMPYLMIGKCAEALALRKAFPQELSGIYTHEEMQQAGPAVHVESRDVTGQPMMDRQMEPVRMSPEERARQHAYQREAARANGEPPARQQPPRADNVERLSDPADSRWQWFERLLATAITLGVNVPKLALPVPIPALLAASRALEQAIEKAGGQLPEPIDSPLPAEFVEEAEWRETSDEEAEQPALV
jgi:phage recombination protein Bet